MIFYEDKRIKIKPVLDAIPRRKLNWNNIYRMMRFDFGFADDDPYEIWIG